MTPAQRQVLAAAMDRVLPPGEGPGAAEAHAIGYVDRTLARPGSARAEAGVEAGVALLDSLAQGMWGRGFAECGPEERDAVLGRLQEVPHPAAQRFFRSLVILTVTGFLCAPRHGGNRGRVGWEFIGFTPHPLTEGATP